MTVLLIPSTLALVAALAVAVVQVTQHDPRLRDAEPPRSHRDDTAPAAWYGRPA